METSALFFAALQSSFILGLIHGVNPCGHSWLILAPFVMGEKRGRVVSILTMAFLGGTALACLLLGATLGMAASFLPEGASYWVDLTTSLILLLLGLLLIYKPGLIHHHDHDHNHDHDHSHDQQGDHTHHHCHSCNTSPKKISKKKWLAPTLFGIGFINMIIPCPTAAVMYGYAIKSGDPMRATAVFASYALSTAISVGAVIFLIFRVTSLAGKLQKDWIEAMIMRIAGGIIVIFSGYTLFTIFAK